jgi:hypothetical protein
MPRDSGGNYTLPPGNPVVDGTVIDVNWANPTLSDVAVQLNNLLTRDGLLGATAPIKFNDGTLALPGITWASEPTMGLWRSGANTMALAIQGVSRQTWTPTGTTISVPVTFSGGASFSGAVGIPLGTEALPSLYFNGDPNTGIYSVGADQFNVTTGGITKIVAVPANVQIRPSAIASAPSLVIGAGTNAVGPGYAIDITGSGVATDYARLRFLNNAYSLERLILATDNAGGYLHTLGALPLVVGTNNTPRLTIAATGEARFTGAFVAAPNFWVAETGAGAGTVGIAANAGASTVYWGNSSGGLGAMDLYAGGFKQVQIGNIASPVNYLTMYGNTASLRPTIEVRGTDANIGLSITTKGAGDVAFFGAVGLHLQLVGAGATWVQISGNTGATPNYPAIGSNAAKINFTVPTRNSGPLSVTADIAATPAAQFTHVSFAAFTNVDGSRPANSKVAEMIFTGGGYQARFLNDAGSDARTIWNSNGGVSATGIANTLFYTGNNDLTMYLHSAGTTGGLGRVCIGSQVPYTQLEVEGVGQETVAIFDPDIVPTKAGSTILLADVGNAAGNGGAILFGAFATSVPGKHFASIRGYITDASANTAGELRFNTKDTSASTGSTQALRLTAAKVILDSRDLPIARDAGAAPASSIPIGGIVIANVGAVVVNALATINAATNNLTITGTSAGTNLTINSGTWRNLGARDTSTGFALWIRTA